jgi:hypothetical protein
VVIYEGEGSLPLESRLRFETLRTLLEKGYAVREIREISDAPKQKDRGAIVDPRLRGDDGGMAEINSAATVGGEAGASTSYICTYGAGGP